MNRKIARNAFVVFFAATLLSELVIGCTKANRAGDPAASEVLPPANEAPLSDQVAASLLKALPSSGKDEEAAATHAFGPCTLSLRIGNVTCDFGLIVYDSAAKGPKVFVLQPASLTPTEDKHLLLTSGVKPPQLLVNDGTGKIFKAVSKDGMREVRLNADGTYTGYLASQGTEVTWTFDSAGHLTRSVDPGTRTFSTYTYTSTGLIQDEQGGGHNTHYTYAADGTPQTVKLDQTLFEFSAPDAKTLLVKKDGKDILGFQKAEGSDLVAQVAVPGTQYFFTYDKGLVTEAKDAQGPQVSIARELNRVSVKQGPSGNVLRVVEFVNNRLASVATPDGREKFTRDAYGRVIERESVGARKLRYAYDKDGRIVHVANIGPTGAVDLVEKARYNEFGQLVSWTNNLKTLTYAYDERGRPRVQKEETPSQVKVTTFETFDDVGRSLKIREDLTVTDSKTTTITYDAQGQAVSKVEVNATGKSTVSVDKSTGSTLAETQDLTGDLVVQKKTVNPLDGSTIEVKRTTTKAGLVEETTVAVTATGAQRVQSNELGVLSTQKFDAQGVLTEFSSRQTEDPAFSWVGQALVAAAKAKAEQAKPAAPVGPTGADATPAGQTTAPAH